MPTIREQIATLKQSLCNALALNHENSLLDTRGIQREIERLEALPSDVPDKIELSEINAARDGVKI